MSLTPEEMAAKLAEMRGRFRERLEVRLDEVSESLAAARRADGANGTLPDLRHLVHKLHGTVGSYGLHDVAAPLQEMERIVDASSAGSPPGNVWILLETLLARAREAASSP